MSDREHATTESEPAEPAAQSATEHTAPFEQPSLSPDVRQRLMRQFEAWLDQMEAGEPPPAGLPEDLIAQMSDETGAAGETGRDCDLYTLYAGLTALSGEVRLQGRAFKQLIDALAPLSQLPRQLDELEKRTARRADDDELPVSGGEICLVMLDLYDRLSRGLETCDHGIASLQNRRRSWLRRWLGPARAPDEAVASTEALRDATALTLARLDAAFDQWGIERIGRIGDSFDPQRMSAVHVRPIAESEPGTVLEVNRSGYALHGQVKATAQVTVARVQPLSC